MYRPNRVEVPDDLVYEMAFSTPNFCFSPYHGTYSTTDGCRCGPPMPEEFTCASILPPHGYTNSQKWTVSSNLSRSTGLQSDFPVLNTGLASDPIGHDRNLNGSFTISEGSHCMLPSENQPILSGSFGCGFEGYGLVPSFVALDSFHSTPMLQGYSMPDQSMQTELGSSHDINSTGILNDDLHMHPSESFFIGQEGWYTSQRLIT
jgi:hypothetical protein